MRCAQPAEQCSHTLGVETRSNGRARNRYCELVSAPTGQIWIVLPEKYELNGSSSVGSSGLPRNTPICSLDERSIRSMNLSPAISSENRVQRWQSTQRSRSSSTWVEIASGFGNSRFCSTNRLSEWPALIAWFCSGHSPPLSHTGQSSGWLIRRNSMMPSCALRATSEVIWVRTTMPSATGLGARGDRLALALDVHQALPAGAGRGQQRVVAEPRDRDAQLLGDPDHQRPLGRLDLDAVDRELNHAVGHQWAPTSSPLNIGALRPSM